MLRNVQLPSFPSSTNCLAWSDDGEIAVAAGEFVFILVPNRLKRSDVPQTTGGEQWNQVRIRINLFTTDEWPFQEPAKLAEFSLGEEQSFSTVVALSWSPPGIGKYRRSALAVLTSSYVLSLWDPGRNPAEPSSWKRAVVINSHVEKYFAGLAVSEETLRRRKRIRSMSWAAALPDNFKRNHEYETFLAINNNFNEVLILGVSRLVPSKGPAAGAKVLSTSSYIPDREAQRQPGQEIKWAPWTLDAARAESILSCNFGGLELSLRFIMLEAQNKNPQGHASAIQEQIEPTLSLEADLDNEQTSRLKEKPYLLGEAHLFFKNRPWDVVSGLCHYGNIYVIVTHLNQLEMFSTETISHMDGTTSEYLSRFGHPGNLCKQIAESARRFSSESQLYDRVTVKNWGLASFRGYVAACITLHPSEMIEYNMAVMEKSTLVFSHYTLESASATKKSEVELQFPWEKQQQSKDHFVIYASIFDTIHQYLDINGPPTDLLSRRTVFFHCCANHVKARYDQLAMEAMITAVGYEAHFLSTIEGTSEDLQGTGSSTDTNNTQQSVKALNAVLLSNWSTNSFGSGAQRLLECCEICKEPILWTVILHKARCVSGHIWNRCPLSFLAIQAPGISKYCSSCGREYLNEELIFRDITGITEQSIQEPSVDIVLAEPMDGTTEHETSAKVADKETLIHGIYRVYDTCIFCGGKFIS